jgi:hypothetical protein
LKGFFCLALVSRLPVFAFSCHIFFFQFSRQPFFFAVPAATSSPRHFHHLSLVRPHGGGMSAPLFASISSCRSFVSSTYAARISPNAG